jgi:hypothetical protein
MARQLGVAIAKQGVWKNPSEIESRQLNKKAISDT